MHKLILVLAVTMLAGCVQSRPAGQAIATRLPNIDSPSVGVSIGRTRGVDSITVKRGGTSTVNYAFGTPDVRTVSVTIPEERYLAFRDLCIAILRDAPKAIDGKDVVNVSLQLRDDQLAHYGLTSSRCTFSHQPGQNRAVDALLERARALLNENRAEDASK